MTQLYAAMLQQQESCETSHTDDCKILGYRRNRFQ